MSSSKARVRYPTHRDFLLDMIDSYMPMLENGGAEEMKIASEMFQKIGIKAEMNLGKDKEEFNTDTEKGQVLTVEWYMGALVGLEQEGAYSCLKDWVNNYDKFTKFKNPPRSILLVN